MDNIDYARVDAVLTTTRAVRRRLDLSRPVDNDPCSSASISPSRHPLAPTSPADAGSSCAIRSSKTHSRDTTSG
jgi:hypothetical protein